MSVWFHSCLLVCKQDCASQHVVQTSSYSVCKQSRTARSATKWHWSFSTTVKSAHITKGCKAEQIGTGYAIMNSCKNCAKTLQDKVNISVAIIPMAEDFGWSSTVSGLVQSSFFFGYMLTQIPGGYIISKKGGRKILPLGVGLWSAATAAVPIMAGTMPGLMPFMLFCMPAHCMLGRQHAAIHMADRGDCASSEACNHLHNSCNACPQLLHICLIRHFFWQHLARHFGRQVACHALYANDEYDA